MPAHGVDNIALQSDGKIVAVGKYVSIAYNAAMARYHADGTVDTSFSGDGIMSVNFTGTPQAYAVAVPVPPIGSLRKARFRSGRCEQTSTHSLGRWNWMTMGRVHTFECIGKSGQYTTGKNCPCNP